MQLASWWVLEHRASPNVWAARLSANLAVTRLAHWIAPVGSGRQRLDIDSTWIPGRGRATTRRRERARPWSLPLPALPAIQRGGHTFVQSATGLVCSLCQHPERTTRGRCPGRLDGSAATELFISCREPRWFQCFAPCVVCSVVVWCEVRCSATALVLRLLGDFWPCATCCWVSCLVPSALHVLTAFLGNSLRACGARFWRQRARNRCHSSKAALSRSCHFALFVNPVARSSTDEFFTLCEVHLDWITNARRRQHACSAGMSSCTCRRSKVCALWQVPFPFSAPHCRRAAAHTARGPSCREVTTCL